MTVITKAITEKKADKMEQPLFVEENPAENAKTDPESQSQKSGTGSRCFVLRMRVHRIHSPATFLLFLIAFMILIIGVYCGLYIYTQYARPQMHRFRTGWYSIPYDSSNKMPYTSDAVQQDLLATITGDIRNSFKERFEIDLENEQYEKIDVPDFRGGRQGRFIHDFTINKTGIIDIEGQCCFVMPLNRQRVLQPRNMYDLIRKMNNGDYDVDTEIVRETMKVVTPPLTDLSVVGGYIARECQDLPTYMLRKVNPNVVKRSISSAVFGQFAGKSIIEFDILNLDAVQAYTKSTPN